MPPTVKKTFRITLKLREIEGVTLPTLADGLEPGVISIVDLVYDMPEAVFRSPMFIRTLLDQRDALTREFVETTVEMIQVN